jgi:hypothetical protein
LLLALLVASAPAAAGASAPAPSARLELRRPPGTSACSSQQQLERSVERRLRRRVFRDASAELELQVVFERTDRQWLVRLELSDAKGPLGERELSTDAAHCSALDDSLALVVALLVDTPPERESEARVAQASPAAQAAAPGPTVAVARRPAAIHIPAETHAPRQGVRLGARASLLAASGLLPSAGLGAQLAAEARWPRMPRLALLVEAFLSQAETVAGRDAGARIRSERVGLEVCPTAVDWGSSEVSVCAGQRAGRVRAEGFGFDRNLSSERLYFALSAGVDWTLALAGWLELSSGARLEVPLTRDDFLVRPASGEASSVFRPAALAATLQLGLGAHF